MKHADGKYIPGFIRKYRRKRAAKFFATAALAVVSASAADGLQHPTGGSSTNRLDVMEMDLEQLMKMPVTSVSRKSEPLSDAAAAIFVITQEDIRRSGA